MLKIKPKEINEYFFRRQHKAAAAVAVRAKKYEQN